MAGIMQDRHGSIRQLAQQIESQLQAIRRHQRTRLDAEYAKGQVTGPQRLVMEVLIRSEGLSVKEISQRVSLAHSTVSGIVDRLQKKGLVDRRTEEGDRRVTRVMASQAVRRFMDRQAPELTLHPLLNALRAARPADRRAVKDGIGTLLRLLEKA